MVEVTVRLSSSLLEMGAATNAFAYCVTEEAEALNASPLTIAGSVSERTS